MRLLCRGGRLCPPVGSSCSTEIFGKFRCSRAFDCRGRCRSQPFATKERYGCGSAACRYTSTRQFAPVFYKTVQQICNCPMGRQSRRPLQQVSALPVGADDPVRPQNAVVFSEIYGEFATSSRADVGIGPYRARRRFAAAHRAGQSPAPTKAWANSYCPANFKRRAFLHQSFKGNCYQSWCTVTGGAYLNARRTTLCVRNG